MPFLMFSKSKLKIAGRQETLVYARLGEVCRCCALVGAVFENY